MDYASLQRTRKLTWRIDKWVVATYQALDMYFVAHFLMLQCSLQLLFGPVALAPSGASSFRKMSMICLYTTGLFEAFALLSTKYGVEEYERPRTRMEGFCPGSYI